MIKKIITIIFSAVFSLALLEILLRLTGFFYGLMLSAPPSYSVNTLNKEKTVVLCLGESTTAWGRGDSYPAFLQRQLDAKYGAGKFQVINEGAPAASTTYIYDNLPKLVEKYQPDFVITMMGVNDVWALSDTSYPFDNFRIIKFFKILSDHYRKYQLAKRIEANENENGKIPKYNNPVETVKPNLSKQVNSEIRAMTPWYLEKIQLADKFLNEKNFSQANEVYKSILAKMKLQPQDLNKFGTSLLETEDKSSAENYLWEYAEVTNEAYIYTGIALSYIHKFGASNKFSKPIIRKFLQKALELDPENEYALRYLGCSYAAENDSQEKAFEMLIKAYNHGSRDPDVIGCIDDISKKLGKSEDSIPYLKSGLYFDGEAVWIWIRLIKTYIDLKDFTNAKKYLADAFIKFPGNPRIKELETRLYSSIGVKNTGDLKTYTVLNFWEYPPTQENYKKIIKYLYNKNISIIVMQYPFREISPLKLLLNDFPEIQYVENTYNFEEAKKSKTYQELFTDDFGQNFGHFTPYSAELISKNIVEKVSFSTKK